MFNKVILVGCLGRDAETKSVGQATLARLSVATTRWDKKSNSEVTDWVPVSLWNPGKVVSHLTKGTYVALEGRVIERAWEAKDGSPRKTLEVHSNFVRLVGGGSRKKADEKDLEITDDDVPF